MIIFHLTNFICISLLFLMQSVLKMRTFIFWCLMFLLYFHLNNATCGSRCTSLPNTDMGWAMEIATLKDIPSLTAQVCCDLCQAYPLCAGFTFVHEHHWSQRICYLKPANALKWRSIYTANELSDKGLHLVYFLCPISFLKLYTFLFTFL